MKTIVVLLVASGIGMGLILSGLYRYKKRQLISKHSGTIRVFDMSNKTEIR